MTAQKPNKDLLAEILFIFESLLLKNRSSQSSQLS